MGVVGAALYYIIYGIFILGILSFVIEWLLPRLKRTQLPEVTGSEEGKARWLKAQTEAVMEGGKHKQEVDAKKAQVRAENIIKNSERLGVRTDGVRLRGNVGNDKAMSEEEGHSTSSSVKTSSMPTQEIREEEVGEQEEEHRSQEDLDVAVKEMKDALDVHPEPHAGAEGTIRIVVRLPDGTRVNRRFYLTDQMRLVYYFVEVQHHVRSFSLESSFPRQIYDDKDKTFTEYGLKSSVLLTARPFE